MDDEVMNSFTVAVPAGMHCPGERGIGFWLRQIHLYLLGAEFRVFESAGAGNGGPVTATVLA